MQEITLPQTNNSTGSDDAPQDQKSKPRKISVISQDDISDNAPSQNPNDKQQANSSVNDITQNKSGIQSSPFDNNFQNEDKNVPDNNKADGIEDNDPRTKLGNSSRTSPFADFTDPWGSDPFSSDNSSRPRSQQKLSPKERVKMIEEIYQQVLGRDPDTRDINYYKYSTLGPDEIKAQLMEGKEHQQLLKDGREYKKMKERAESAEVRVKALESQIKDQVDEFKYLSDLLKQKNTLIQELRAQLNNPYNIDRSDQRVVSQMGVDSFRVGVSPEDDQRSKDPNSQIQNEQIGSQGLQNSKQSHFQTVKDNQGTQSLPGQSTQNITIQEQKTNDQYSKDHSQNYSDRNPSYSNNVQIDNQSPNGSLNDGNEVSSVQETRPSKNYENDQEAQNPIPTNNIVDSTAQSVNKVDDQEEKIDKDEVVGFFDVGLDDAFSIISGGTKSNENVDFEERQRENFKNTNIESSNNNIPPTVSSKSESNEYNQTQRTFQNQQSSSFESDTRTSNQNRVQDQSTPQNSQNKTNQNLVFSSVEPVVQMNDKDKNKKDKTSKISSLLGRVKDSLAP